MGENETVRKLARLTRGPQSFYLEGLTPLFTQDLGALLATAIQVIESTEKPLHMFSKDIVQDPGCFRPGGVFMKSVTLHVLTASVESCTLDLGSTLFLCSEYADAQTEDRGLAFKCLQKTFPIIQDDKSAFVSLNHEFPNTTAERVRELRIKQVPFSFALVHATQNSSVLVSLNKLYSHTLHHLAGFLNNRGITTVNMVLVGCGPEDKAAFKGVKAFDVYNCVLNMIKHWLDAGLTSLKTVNLAVTEQRWKEINAGLASATADTETQSSRPATPPAAMPTRVTTVNSETQSSRPSTPVAVVPPVSVLCASIVEFKKQSTIVAAQIRAKLESRGDRYPMDAFGLYGLFDKIVKSLEQCWESCWDDSDFVILTEQRVSVDDFCKVHKINPAGLLSINSDLDIKRKIPAETGPTRSRVGSRCAAHSRCVRRYRSPHVDAPGAVPRPHEVSIGTILDNLPKSESRL